jgi:4-alpha-glucanotransferase
MFKNRRVACLDIHSPLYLKTRRSLYGGGDIDDLYLLVDRAAEAGFSLIQFNPLQDTGTNPCPYMGISIFSYNPAHLAVDEIPETKEIAELKRKFADFVADKQIDQVDYRDIYNFKYELLRSYYQSSDKKDLISTASSELLAYAVFKTLKKRYRSRWVKWPTRYKYARQEQIIEMLPNIRDEVNFYLFAQEVLKGQWLKLRDYAKEHGVEFVIDKPIYPIHDSAEVWANQGLFYLRKDGELRYGSGCNNPRDQFGAQYWGHAVYKYQEKSEESIEYFCRIVEHLGELSPVVRLDHALALIWKYFLVDPKTKVGKHRPALKGKLFKPLLARFPQLFFIAEDVGFVSNRFVDKPLSVYNIYGMRCLQWYVHQKYFDLSLYPEYCMAMTANHDTQSLVAWWRELRSGRRDLYLRQLLDQERDLDDKVTLYALTSLLFNSKAAIATVTLRDLVSDRRRYNKPGQKLTQNWRLRSPEYLEETDFAKVGKIIEASSRRRGTKYEIYEKSTKYERRTKYK